MSHLRQEFIDTSSKFARKKTPPPFSLRLSPEERQKLETAAAGMPLGPFIKAKLFNGDLTPRKTRGQAPVKDHAALAQALGLLGNLRLANNLNQLAKAANMGALPMSAEVEEELIATCAAVLAIRMELMKALGYESEDRS
jgi:hypothetical protein